MWFRTSIYLPLITALDEAGVKDPDACMKWAFGEEYRNILISQSDDVWNKRHGDLFTLCGSDNVIESMKRIGRAYVKEVQK